MNAAELERAASDEISLRYEARGYRKVPSPGATPLPSAIGTYRPDLVLEKDGRFLAVEIKSRRIASLAKQLDELRRRFERDQRWGFEVVYLDDMNLRQGPPVQNRDQIEAALREAQGLVHAGQLRPAFLIIWATFEAAARVLEEGSFERPQTPGRLVTVLAEKGHVTTDEAEQLRRLASTRNALVHGELSVGLTEDDCLTLISIVETVLKA